MKDVSNHFIQLPCLRGVIKVTPLNASFELGDFPKHYHQHRSELFSLEIVERVEIENNAVDVCRQRHIEGGLSHTLPASEKWTNMVTNYHFFEIFPT